MKQESFIATILEDGRITIPKPITKLKRATKGKAFRFIIMEEVRA
jgi:bifunctional DNA-binding transcriptional regulator/antitoxin component of YhaV-PrlF toxin-antitoxin module